MWQGSNQLLDAYATCCSLYPQPRLLTPGEQPCKLLAQNACIISRYVARGLYAQCMLFSPLHLSALHDFDNKFRPIVWSSRDVLDFPQRKHSVNHFAKDYVFPV